MAGAGCGHRVARAALALPQMLQDGSPFPERDPDHLSHLRRHRGDPRSWQGLTLSRFIRMLKVGRDEPAEEQQRAQMRSAGGDRRHRTRSREDGISNELAERIRRIRRENHAPMPGV